MEPTRKYNQKTTDHKFPYREIGEYSRLIKPKYEEKYKVVYEEMYRELNRLKEESSTLNNILNNKGREMSFLKEDRFQNVWLIESLRNDMAGY